MFEDLYETNYQVSDTDESKGEMRRLRGRGGRSRGRRYGYRRGRRFNYYKRRPYYPYPYPYYPYYASASLPPVYNYLDIDYNYYDYPYNLSYEGFDNEQQDIEGFDGSSGSLLISIILILIILFLFYYFFSHTKGAVILKK
ncbi:MAG: hypothetical protein Barrevirus15_9 [Barrevirus sp.]|uniref:Uncharacterized protein n=1 Tax=Barrevirus sp. TaxID=2487763 RepID=A0A3G4ZT27_9VIRU|nr:MAG: hypothetical protein Barrevirus15_9 [Barrevirus sp.]